MKNFIQKYWIICLLLFSISGIYAWYNPNYCYKEGKKFIDADFKDGLPNSKIVSELAYVYDLARWRDGGKFDGKDFNKYENDLKKLEVKVDKFYKKYPYLKGGRVNGKGYIYDPDWDYAIKYARYFFHPNDIKKINIYLNKQTYPPKKTVVGFYDAAFYNKCGKFTGSAMVDRAYIYKDSDTDLKFNPYKTQKINK